MDPQNQTSQDFPLRLDSPSGLSIQMNANGSIRRIDHRDILMNLYLGTEIEGGPANIYLRRHGTSIQWVPLLGPGSPAALRPDAKGAFASGEWQGIRIQISLRLAESAPAWFWHVALRNAGPLAETLDLIFVQDLALAHYGAVRLNEHYVCHYLDHTALSHPDRGFVLASRQNMSMGGMFPWTIIGALGRGIGFSTDALQFHALETRAGRSPLGIVKGLPGARLQHEHSMVGIQDAPVRLDPGGTVERGFFAWFEADHPAATCEADLAFIDRIMSLPEAEPPIGHDAGISPKPAATLFSAVPVLCSLDLSEDEISELFGRERRHEERKEGELQSFFADPQRHVVLKAKELGILRPHAHILRTGDRLVPEETSLTSTTRMAGVFHSMVTQGHVAINRLLSTVHSYLGLLRGNGQRLFAELDGRWHLLDMPSAYEMTPRSCRWIYRHASGMIQIRSEASAARHELTLRIDVLSGPPARFFLSNHVAMNGDDGSEAIPVGYDREGEGVFIRPLPDSDVGRRFPDGGFELAPLPGTMIERIGGDELLFLDDRSRNQPFLCMITGLSKSAAFSIKGRLIPEDSSGAAGRKDAGLGAEITYPRIHPPAGSPLSAGAEQSGEILPWFIHNALIHYLAPRGIEQYTGGGWGTRDICQGAVEMLLALGRFEPIRDLLIRVFKAQNADGDWPQWFMFFDRERNIRPGDSHGDIIFWPVLALAQYLIVSLDKSFLEEPVPFFHPEGDHKAEWVPIWRHVERALDVIDARVIPGTRLAAYGNGDWNDSLQPVQPAMREQLCSTWTVTLQVQTLTTLASALDGLGMSERAAGLETAAARVREDFERLLIMDETLTGFAYFQGDGRVDYLLHPRDRLTGLSYSILPMIHAVINDLLTPQQAEKHLALIRTHLLGPDGARLFDRPMEYRGGPQRLFQRAESASFFGREIGLMYTHAHLRYAEALAHYGDADGFFRALSQANPIGIRELVHPATPRQANCYYSSSDAAFADRYQASAEYDKVKKGEISLDGGWRVYSSGAGIWVRLLLQCFLGVRLQKSRIEIDPVIPSSLDGLKVEWELAGHAVVIEYRIKAPGWGPMSVTLNGRTLPFTRGSNPYRTGAAEIPMEAVQESFREGANHLLVCLG